MRFAAAQHFAEKEEVAVSVCNNDSGMVECGFVSDDIPSAKMLGIMAGRDQKDCYVGDEA